MTGPEAGPLGADDPTSLGPYTLIGRLGEGGMGSVFLGRAADGRVVAVKMIRGDLASSPEFRSRFLREAQAARHVARFCTAEVLDVNTEGARPYMVTEFVDGPTLADAVRQRGPLPSGELERLAVAVASALTAIHAANVIHRDLKPSNIMLSSSGARVIDFGIARATDSTTMITHASIGTPAFMAPEQALGQPVTEAADVYAWGGVVLFAGTGRMPFGEGPTPVILYRLVYHEPDLTGLDEGLRPLVEQAMSKDPAQRPTAHDLFLRLVGSPPASRDLRASESVTAAGPASLTGTPQAETTGSEPISATTRRLPPKTPNTPVSLPNTGTGTGTGTGSRPVSEPVAADTARTDTARTGRQPVPPVSGVEGRPVDPRPRRRWFRRPRIVVPLAILVAAAVAGATVGLVRTLGGHGAAPPARLVAPPLTGHTNWVRSVAFSPDGTMLATGSEDRTVRLWNLADRTAPRLLAQPLTQHTDAVWSVAFSPDNHTLATGSLDGTIRLWDLTERTSPRPLGQPLAGHDEGVATVAFSPDGDTLATGGGDNTIRLWDLTDRAAAQPLGEPITGHTDWVRSVAFSRYGTTLASGSSDKTIRLWDLTDPANPEALGQPIIEHRGAVTSVAFSPDGAVLATSSDDGTVRLWVLGQHNHPRPLTGHSGFVLSLAYSPDGTRVASGGEDQTVRLWDLSDFDDLRPLGTPLLGHRDWVWALAFSPDGTTLASASHDQTVRLWDLTGQE